MVMVFYYPLSIWGAEWACAREWWIANGRIVNGVYSKWKLQRISPSTALAHSHCCCCTPTKSGSHILLKAPHSATICETKTKHDTAPILGKKLSCSPHMKHIWNFHRLAFNCHPSGNSIPHNNPTKKNDRMLYMCIMCCCIGKLYQSL